MFFGITKVKQYLVWLAVIGLLFAAEACRSRKGSTRKPARLAKSGKPAAGKGRTITAKPTAKPRLTAKGDAAKVVSTARSYTGTPHRDGGSTRNGIDCSGLVQISFASIGMAIPRNSRDQAKMAKPVTLSGVKPGDLLFFNTSGGGISHVGIVTEVLDDDDVRFIHTSSSLGVTENLLSTPYWKQRYLQAGRVL